MKLVMQMSGRTVVTYLPEFAVERTISELAIEYPGVQTTPMAHEVYRYRLDKGVIYITKTRRRNRAREKWFETRALTALARELRESFRCNIPVKVGTLLTEVDGIGLQTGTVVEATTSTVTQKWIDFYDDKRKALASDYMIVMAPGFSRNLSLPPRIKPYKVELDWSSVQQFYDSYSFPSWFEAVVPSRHIRVFTSSGQWKGLPRSLTPTAKHTPESKLRSYLRQLSARNNLPVKMYYSQAFMLNPPREFRGKGYPIPRIVAAFDVDSDNHEHQIGPDGYCTICQKDAERKKSLIESRLRKLGYHPTSLHSGTKGYHVYCRCDSSVLECDLSVYEQILDEISDLTDSSRFRNEGGSYDLHRILKLPGSVDCETGMVVDESRVRVPLLDEIVEI